MEENYAFWGTEQHSNRRKGLSQLACVSCPTRPLSARDPIRADTTSRHLYTGSNSTNYPQRLHQQAAHCTDTSSVSRVFIAGGLASVAVPSRLSLWPPHS